MKYRKKEKSNMHCCNIDDGVHMYSVHSHILHTENNKHVCAACIQITTNENNDDEKTGVKLSQRTRFVLKSMRVFMVLYIIVWYSGLHVVCACASSHHHVNVLIGP